MHQIDINTAINYNSVTGVTMDNINKEVYALVQRYLKKYINEPIKHFLKKGSVDFLKISTQIVLLNLIYENILCINEVVDKSKLKFLDYSKK
jgi:hypothetical protein